MLISVSGGMAWLLVGSDPLVFDCSDIGNVECWSVTAEFIGRLAELNLIPVEISDPEGITDFPADVGNVKHLAYKSLPRAVLRLRVVCRLWPYFNCNTKCPFFRHINPLAATTSHPVQVMVPPLQARWFLGLQAISSCSLVPPLCGPHLLVPKLLHSLVSFLYITITAWNSDCHSSGKNTSNVAKVEPADVWELQGTAGNLG